MFHQPPVLHRFFFALHPPVALARQIANATVWFDGGRGAVRADRLHITLAILDDCAEVSPEMVETLRDVGARIAAEPVAVTLDTVVASGRSIALRPRLRNAALEGLRRRIATGLAAADLAERVGYRFGPHMTLGYRDGQPFTRATAPVAWIADTLTLVQSHVGRTRHDILARWPLDGRDDAQLALF